MKNSTKSKKYIITFGFTKHGSLLCHLLLDSKEKISLSLLEENFFWKDQFIHCDQKDLKFELIDSIESKYFNSLEKAKEDVLSLFALKMKLREEAISDRNLVYLQIIKLNKEISSLKEDIADLQYSLNRLS